MTRTLSTNFEFLGDEYRNNRRQHWDSVILRSLKHKGLGGYYHNRLREIFCFYIPPGSRILEIGSGTGDLLAGLVPAFGLGIDFSSQVLKQSKKAHPGCQFVAADGHSLPLSGKFDYIILSDLLNDVFDVQTLLSEVRRLSTPATRILINCYSRVWQVPLWLAEKLGLAKPNLPQNWLTPEDIQSLLNLTDMEIIRHWMEVLLPFNIPLITQFFNKFLIRFWPFTGLGLTNFYLARSLPDHSSNTQYSVSVVIPARNEAGNISEIFKRIKPFGTSIELIFVEGHSTDRTYATILREIKTHPHIRSQVYRQSGTGKADAVRIGFDHSKGEVLMILDADLTVPPEYLERFYQALIWREGEFINGVRLVYPLPRESMQYINFLGNKFFSLAFTWLLGQPTKDTLCGTKVMFRSDYNHIAANHSYFGDFDPFGDFDLLFGASKLGLKIIDIPIRYQERSYGHTNIRRYKHGALLIKMLLFAAHRLKFI